MTALADLLKGDFNLLLYFSETRTRNRNSTTVPMNLTFFISVFYCVSRKDF